MRLWSVSFALLLSTPMAVLAHDYSLGSIQIVHPAARPTAPGAMAGAGYFTLTNTGDQADTLRAVEADFPRVMMHETVMQGDVARMEHLMSVPIAPGETVAFEPGGKHVMFMGLNGDPFELGEEIPGTLVFENAGRIEVMFVVEDMAEGVDHSNH